MIYLTTGIIDQYDNPKVNFECAVTKAYSQDVLRNVTDFALSLVNAPTTVADHPIGLPVDIRDAIQLQHIETSVELKSHVGRMGLQHAMVRTRSIKQIISMQHLKTHFLIRKHFSLSGKFWSQYKRLQRFSVD